MDFHLILEQVIALAVIYDPTLVPIELSCNDCRSKISSTAPMLLPPLRLLLVRRRPTQPFAPPPSCQCPLANIKINLTVVRPQVTLPRLL